MSECSDGDGDAAVAFENSVSPEPRQSDSPGPARSASSPRNGQPGAEGEARLKGSMTHLPSLLLRRHNHQNQVPGFQKHGGGCRRCVARLEHWYVRSWWAQFICGLATVLGMIVDPVLDYCTIYIYAHNGHLLWASLGVVCVLVSPWLSLWLHLRASRADLVRPQKRLWLKLLVVPVYEAAVGWRAIKFMWGVRGDPKLYPAIEVAMSEVLILAGQEAVFESLPQLIVQIVAYFNDYYGTATSRQNFLFLASMATSALVIASRIISTLLFVNDGGLAAFAYLTRINYKEMRHTLATATPFTAAREAEERTKGVKYKGFGADLWLSIERQVYRTGTSNNVRRANSWSASVPEEDSGDEQSGLPDRSSEEVREVI
eukprot:Hpha_TRINITY_DN7350_c0_g1::TRINITY_DN7350_c0_g1_i1::g.9997::m.9997